MQEQDIHKNGPIRNGPPKTNNTGGNEKYSGKQNHQRNVKKISREIYMIFYWVRDRIQQYHFHIFWEEGKKTLADYVTKHHPICHHKKMIPRYLKTTKKYIKLKRPANWERKRVC